MKILLIYFTCKIVITHRAAGNKKRQCQFLNRVKNIGLRKTRGKQTKNPVCKRVFKKFAKGYYFAMNSFRA